MTELNLGEWKNFIDELDYNMKNDNISNFQNWGIINRTMIAGVDLVEFEYLMSCINWDIWKSKLSEDVLKPNSYINFNSSSTNNIHHAYSLQIMMDYFNMSLNDFDDIIEFGGGYGNTCRLIKKWNHNKNYYIYDIPQLIEIQKYYLNANNVKDNIIYKTGFDIIDNVKGNSLFLGLWSISETPIEERYIMLDNLNFFKCKNIFIAMGGSFCNENNMKWLEEIIIPKLISLKYEYKLEPIKHGVDMFYFMAKLK